MNGDQAALPRVGLNAHLLSSDASYRAAGVSRYVARLLRHLPDVEQGLDYVAFMDRRSVAPAGWHAVASPWRTRVAWARVAFEQIGLPVQARRARLSLLHAPVNVTPVSSPCPLVVTVHDLSPFLYPALFRPVRRTYQQSQTRRSVRAALHVIADSESTRSDLVRVLGVAPEHVTAIPLGVDEDLRPVEDAAALRAFRRRQGVEEPFVLFVGTLEPRKNVVMLVEAFSRWRHRGGRRHRLVLAGGRGWYDQVIFRRVEALHLSDVVLFPGHVPDVDLPYWYSAAEMFVYPSLYEGFGLPPLEAMACGAPVIASSVSSLPESVGDAGMLVDPRDVDAWAEAMDALADDPERRVRLRAAGLERAGRLTWRETARRTATLYVQLLGKCHGANA